MPQRQWRDLKQMRSLYRACATQCSLRARCPHQCQFTAQTVHANLGAQCSCIGKNGIGHFELCQFAPPACDLLEHFLIIRRPLLSEAIRVTVLRGAALHDFDPILNAVRGAHFHRQSKPVEQLWAELAFFRVAAANQHEFRAVAD